MTKLKTVLGSIPASSDTVEFEWRQMKQFGTKYIKIQEESGCKKAIHQQAGPGKNRYDMSHVYLLDFLCTPVSKLSARNRTELSYSPQHPTKDSG